MMTEFPVLYISFFYLLIYFLNIATAKVCFLLLFLCIFAMQKTT